MFPVVCVDTPPTVATTAASPLSMLVGTCTLIWTSPALHHTCEIHLSRLSGDGYRHRIGERVGPRKHLSSRNGWIRGTESGSPQNDCLAGMSRCSGRHVAVVSGKLCHEVGARMPRKTPGANCA